MPNNIFESERKRLDSIKVIVPKPILNNVMTDGERDWFIRGQKVEFKKLEKGAEALKIEVKKKDRQRSQLEGS